MANFNTSPVGSGKAAVTAALVRPSAEPESIRILLANEPSMYRDGLRAVLAAQPDLKIVAEADDDQSILPLARKHQPDIILFEPETAGASLPVLRLIQQSDVRSRVILLTGNEDEGILSQAVRFGVSGVVPKKSPTELLLKSIRKVNAGEVWLDRMKTADALRQLTSRPIPPPRGMKPADKPAEISRREREIVALVAQGFRNREIAEKLFITEQTVKNHMHNIFEKVGVEDRLELALYAIYHRLYE